MKVAHLELFNNLWKFEIVPSVGISKKNMKREPPRPYQNSLKVTIQTGSGY